MTRSDSTRAALSSSSAFFPRGVTVVVPSHNRAAGLRRCLQALFACEMGSLEVEIFVVDDGSTDDTRAVVASVRGDCPPGLRLHYRHQENRGPAAARNLAAREAQGDLLLFTDDDCEPAPGWIRGIVQHAWTAEVGGVAGKIVSQEAGNWVARYCRYFGYNEFPPRNKPLRRVNFGNTANCAFRRELFLELEGFEEIMSTVGYEDVDFSRRVMVHGFRVEYEPKAVVEHYHREDVKSFCRAFRKRGYAGPLLELLWETPFEITWDGLAREVLDLLCRAAGMPMVLYSAACLRREGVAREDALRFAWLQWLSELARRCGSIAMCAWILTGRQSLVRTSRMPSYRGSLRTALRDARRRQDLDIPGARVAEPNRRNRRAARPSGT